MKLQKSVFFFSLSPAFTDEPFFQILMLLKSVIL